MSTAESPEFTAVVNECGDPHPVLAEIAETTKQPPPCIDEAHTPQVDEDEENDPFPEGDTEQ